MNVLCHSCILTQVQSSPVCHERKLAATCLQENGDTFEALKTMSAYFLRADAHAICDCIQAFHLNDLLFSVVRLDGLFACWQDPSTGRRTTMEPGISTLQTLCGWYSLLRG